MPRGPRITQVNGCYHIITRGNQKQLVFMDKLDYEKYLTLLIKYKKRYKFKLYCFCLMPNHVHLIIEVKDPSILKKFMHGLNLSYTIYFNLRHEKVGHLWQDRFKSKIIEKDAYLLECINYIETNPLRSSLVSEPTMYPWNSLNFKRLNNDIVDSLF